MKKGTKKGVWGDRGRTKNAKDKNQPIVITAHSFLMYNHEPYHHTSNLLSFQHLGAVWVEFMTFPAIIWVSTHEAESLHDPLIRKYLLVQAWQTWSLWTVVCCAPHYILSNQCFSSKFHLIGPQHYTLFMIHLHMCTGCAAHSLKTLVTEGEERADLIRQKCWDGCLRGTLRGQICECFKRKYYRVLLKIHWGRF